MNLPTLPMTREEFWRQYWDRINPLHLRQGVSHENLNDAADDYGWVMPVTVYMTGASLAT